MENLPSENTDEMKDIVQLEEDAKGIYIILHQEMKNNESLICHLLEEGEAVARSFMVFGKFELDKESLAEI